MGDSADELALEFGDYYPTLRPGFASLKPDLDLSLLDEVDAELSTMSSTRDVALWTVAALEERVEWKRLRAAAARAIDALEKAGIPTQTQS